VPNLVDLGAVAFTQWLDEDKVFLELGVVDYAHVVRFESGAWDRKIGEAN
jgi:hypothetical protein